MWYSNASEFMADMGHDRDGEWLPRVTRILDIKAKPALESFMKEVGSFEAAEEIKNKSAKEGSLVHEVVQKVAIGEPVEIPDSIAPAVAAFEDFAARRGIHLHPDHIERPVISRQNRYTGTVDALAEIDGKFGVLDIKTSTGFYREYNLQTAAYVLALQEAGMKQLLALPRDIQTRWILRVNQHRVCSACGATLREKGGRNKIRSKRSVAVCAEDAHAWGVLEGDVELKEFPYYQGDIKAFLAAKTLWEWEHGWWLKQIGYL
ncbi:MAG: hypothetical protein AAB710_00685 [Patescibacteria group bacterium]